MYVSRSRLNLLSLGLVLLMCLSAYGVEALEADLSNSGVARKIKFDFDWLFFKGDDPTAAQFKFSDAGWRQLNLPHDWSIEGPFDKDMKNGARMGFLPGGIGWYRKHFTVPAEWKGKKVSIQFDGVYHQSDVYLNGRHLGFRPYGYVSFEYDLSPFLKPGEENVLAVRVDHSNSPSSRWYSGSGIYRHVWLSVTNPLHVAHWGTYVTTPAVSEKVATVRARTTIRNDDSTATSCVLESSVEDSEGRVVARGRAEQDIRAGSEAEFDQTLAVTSPALWSIEQPNLYKLQTTVLRGGSIVDEYRTSFGIRNIRFDSDTGFLLNGRSLKMKGVCIHGDAGCLGTAVPDRALKRRLEILKDWGCNAIRTSHNPPAPELLDMCDRLGFVVIDEAFDKWRGGYYGKYFDEWWQRDLDAMLRRDRNHPCVVLWSVGNEVDEMGKPEGTETLKMLVDHVDRTEPTRAVTCAVRPKGDAEDRPVNSSGFAAAMDVVALNYQEPYYESDRAQYPHRIIVGSEVYPYFNGRPGSHKDFRPVNPWYDVVKHEYVIGQFLWAGIDYLGESSGWPSKGWATGPIDDCGFLKPFSYFHRSVWRDDPLVHIAVVNDTLDVDPGKLHWG
jgi:beta-galactosidase